MTCAHVVNVALKKVAGVESVEVSLNKGLAKVRLRPGNTVSVAQLWKLIHDNGYTPKETVVLVRGNVLQGKTLQLKISATGETVDLSAESTNSAAYDEVSRMIGRAVSMRGVMTPAKDLKAPVPLQVKEVK